MKAIKLKLEPFEVRSLCNLARMYIAGLELENNGIAYLNTVILRDYLEKLEKKLPYFTKPVAIGVEIAALPIFCFCYVEFKEEIPPLELSIAQRIVAAADKAIQADRRAMAIMQQYRKNQRTMLLE